MKSFKEIIKNWDGGEYAGAKYVYFFINNSGKHDGGLLYDLVASV